jgi:hypothetical protein
MWRRFKKDLHGATSQKTALFIVIALKTSDLTNEEFCAGFTDWLLKPPFCFILDHSFIYMYNKKKYTHKDVIIM